MRRFYTRWGIRGLALLTLASSLMALLPVLGTAQSGPPILTINQVLTEGFPQVVSYVTVVDASGLAISGLTEDAFTFQEDGNAVAQFVVSRASQEGIHVILCVDTSGSMRGGTALSDAQSAARTFLSQLTPKDRAGLIVFAESATLVQDFTDDLTALETAIDDLAALPQAPTALYEAAFEAGDRMAQLPPGRKAVIIFTDGTDTVGGLSLKDAIDKAQEANVPIYTIGLLGGEFDPAPMRQLAETTGGFYLEAPTSEELSAKFQAVRQLLEHQYAIRYTSTMRPDDHLHDLGISVTVGGARAEDHHPFLPLPLVPWVQITKPSDGEDVVGSVPVAVDVAARESIAKVVLLVDGTELARPSGPPYRHDWDTALLSPGSHVLATQATDADGRTGSAQVSVNVKPALTLALTSPTDGSDVVGLVEIRPDIRAARNIRQVVVSVDGTVITTLTASPYIYLWDTAPLTLGRHVLAVTAEDDQGATAQAQAQVNVQPALTLTLSSPADGASVIGVVDVQPDIQAARKLRQVVVSVDGTPVATVPAPPYTYRWDTAELTPGPHQVLVNAEDEQGAAAQAQVRVNVQPVLTTTWLSPQPGAEMTATVSLVAQAQAHYGVERVEFYANDRLLGAVKEPPFELEWSTLSLEEKNYKLLACAYDVLGHEVCAGVTLELKRPGPGLAMFLALGVLLVAIVGVTAMVVRTRQRQAAARVPAPAISLVPPLPPVDVGVRPTPEPRAAARPPVPMSMAEAPRRPMETAEDLPRTAVDQPTLMEREVLAAWFVVQPAEGGATWELNLRTGEAVIGRSEDSDIRIEDELVSRQHAVVQYQEDGEGYVFRDLNPTNPSIINGEEYREPHVLRPGDSILIGTTMLTFRRESQ